jgi:hypothetical protein
MIDSKKLQGDIMEIILKIDNPNMLEKQLFDFLKQQKEEFKDITIEALSSFINNFHKQGSLNYKKKDISKNLSLITFDDNEPRDKSIKLYQHIEDSGEYIHNLRRKKYI